MSSSDPHGPTGAGRSFDLAAVRAIVGNTPATLRAMLTGLPVTWWHAHEGPGSWTVFQVVVHLTELETTNWKVRLRHVREQRPGAFPVIDRTGGFDAAAGTHETSWLDRFAERRAENLATLDAWHADDFERTAEHPEFGLVHGRELVAAWAAHDLDHLVQIARILAKHGGDATGPWRRYLSVLSDRTT